MSSISEPPNDKFRILCIDGGGMRGLLSVRVIAELERLVASEVGAPARICDYFHLVSGTSTGGLIALALTAPEEISTETLARFYKLDGPEIFRRSLLWKLRTLWGLRGPKYGAERLEEAVKARLGESLLSEAKRDVLVTSYDMENREPFFFKRWRAIESAQRAKAGDETGSTVGQDGAAKKRDERDGPIFEAALATSAAPTYFPSQGVNGRALVDGGVFAANPAIAAITEALGRNSDPPAGLAPADLMVVSVGTGRFETGFAQSEVGDWGLAGWGLGGGEHPILSAMLGGSSDGTDYWAHMLLNHAPGEARPKPEEVGRGPRFFRLQAALEEEIAMDDASKGTLGTLEAAAAKLIDESERELQEIAKRLTEAGPIG